VVRATACCPVYPGPDIFFADVLPGGCPCSRDVTGLKLQRSAFRTANPPYLRNLLLVGGGGFLGSIARYLLGGLVLQASGAPRFPLATLIVNVTGCLAIGIVAGMAERTSMFTPATRLFLITGLLGGYTTFSAFAFETSFLVREQAWASAALNVVAQVGLGLLAVWAGYRMAVLIGT
jgi:CrcB protein